MPRASRTHPLPKSAQIEALEMRRLLAAGSLDPSFSGDGKVTLVPPSETLITQDVAVQADGKTVVVGRSSLNTGGSVSVQFVTARFNIDGSLDASFANGGIARTQLSERSYSFANAVAIAPDGKIVVVGVTNVVDGDFDQDQVGVARYNPNGSLDNSFSGDGKLGIDLTGSRVLGAEGEDVAVQPDGRIVVVGKVDVDGNQDNFFATRLNQDGSSDGTRRMDFGAEEGAVAVKLDGNGRVFVAGTLTDPRSTPNDPVVQRVGLARFTPGGPVDYQATFGLPLFSSGNEEFRVTSVQDLILQPGGKVVIAGHASSGTGETDFFVARFTDTGELDTTFGQFGFFGPRGFRITDLGGHDVVGGMTHTPGGAGGGFIVSGFTSSGAGGMAAVKYTDDGALDTSFGVGGIARVPGFGGTASIAPGPGRRVVLAGGLGFATARLLLAGANVVSAGVLDGLAGEGTTNTGLLAVGRIERLPFPTRVYISIGGTAAGRTPALAGTLDYTLDKLVQPIATFGGGTDTRPYVEIPANETFVFVTLTTRNDTRIEGSESAVFSIIPDPGYEIGTPSTGTVTITDDDRLTFTVGTTEVTPPPKHVEEGREVQTSVTWTVPSGGWRQLSTIQVRLRDLDDDDALVLLTFDEATNSFSLDATAGAAGRVALVPGQSTFAAAGPTAPTVTVTFAYRFTSAAAAHRFALDVSADNDAGDASGFSEFARVFVRKKVKRHDLLLS